MIWVKRYAFQRMDDWQRVVVIGTSMVNEKVNGDRALGRAFFGQQEFDVNICVANQHRFASFWLQFI